PNPTVVREIGPATIVISGPTEILIADPGPSVIRVRPVPVGVRTPVWIPYYNVRLPTVAITFDVNPAATRQVVVNKINRYIVAAALRNSRHSKRQHRYCEQKSFHNHEISDVRLSRRGIYSTSDSQNASAPRVFCRGETHNHN